MATEATGGRHDGRNEGHVSTVRRAIRELPWTTRLLLLSGLVGALPFGVLQVFYPLYLHGLGIHAVVIGSLFTVVGLSAALLTFAIGPLADRFGRRRFLLAGTALPLLGFAIFALTTERWWLVAASLLSIVGFTGGLSGALVTATFFPLLSDTVSPQRRTTTLSWAEGGLSLCVGGGMVLATVPSLL